MLSTGSVVMAKCRFDGVGECKETIIMIWSAEVDGDVI